MSAPGDKAFKVLGFPSFSCGYNFKYYNKGQIEKVQKLRQGDDCTSILKVCQLPGSSHGSSVVWLIRKC